MSHTTPLGPHWFLIHNSDFSGDVEISRHGGGASPRRNYTIPAVVLIKAARIVVDAMAGHDPVTDEPAPDARKLEGKPVQTDEPRRLSNTLARLSAEHAAKSPEEQRKAEALGVAVAPIPGSTQPHTLSPAQHESIARIVAYWNTHRAKHGAPRMTFDEWIDRAIDEDEEQILWSGGPEAERKFRGRRRRSR